MMVDMTFVICGFSSHQESPLTVITLQRWKRPHYGKLIKSLSTLGCSQSTHFHLSMSESKGSYPSVLWVMLHSHRLCCYTLRELRVELCRKYWGKKKSMVYDILLSQEISVAPSENAPKTKVGWWIKSNENCQKCIENVSWYFANG